jgi:diguanylate cyclase (GGDEF)-like protein
MIATKMNRVSGGGASYRYGGEEFSVIFSGKDSEAAKPHLEELRETIANTPFIINRASRRKADKKFRKKKNKAVKVTVSIGVADSRADISSPWDVLKLSDKALYRAKAKGRNRVCD